ncbi:MAG: hypothetical protein ABSD53_22665 [Terriglobales bacterium]
MNSLQLTRKLTHLVMAGIASMSFALVVNAQVNNETSIAHGPATKTVSVDRGEVVYASGSDLVLKKDDGTVVHFANVSDTATVDGKRVSVDDLEPGMKLERTITTTTTPHTVTSVQAVTGKVWHVNPPRFVILTLEDGTNHKFDLPNDHKVLVDGRLVDAWKLKKGMKISATRVIEAPGTVVAQETKLTGTAPPPIALAANEPIFFTMFVTAPAQPTLAEAIPVSLPETGSSLPLVGVLGVLALGSFLGLRAIRVTA